MAIGLTFPLPSSLQNRLILTHLVLMIISLSSLIVWIGQRLHRAIIEQAEHNLEIEAFLIANALQEPMHEWAEEETTLPQASIRSYAQNITGRVTITDAHLYVLFSSDPRVPIHIEENHAEFLAARSGSEQHDIRLDEWSGEERLFVAAPILGEEQELLGFVQLSVPMAPIYSQIRQTWLNLFTIGAMILGGTVLAGLWLAHQISRPVEHLTQMAEEIAQGNLEQRVTPAGPEEIQRLGRAFNRMADRIQEMLARQQAFVANAAHELRSPLTSFRLRLEMLQTHARHHRELTERYLHEMEKELDHLQTLVDHLLALTTLDSGQPPERAQLDLAPLLYELAEAMMPLIQQAGLTLSLEVPHHLPPVLANAEQMRIVFRNLLDNAIKYTPQGGKILLYADTLAARATSLPASPPLQTVSFFSRQPNPAPKNPTSLEVRIQVADNGIGISPEDLLRIFDRFYRADHTRSRRRSGAGLGLSLVQSIVQAHAGRVEVSSLPGKGSTFTVYLPVASIP